ncbi:MAG: AMP-binding protein, partial [Christensenellaceae bacterium]|nr:AMP-binding protein [Christensenellaceae bacterium]
VETLIPVLKVDESFVFGMQVPLYVDACLKEIFSTLKCGAHTWLIKKSLFMFPVKLVEYLNEHKINTLCWVVSALTMISSLGAFKKCVPEHLKTVAFGSEVFPIPQLNLWRQHVPCRYLNLYGPTEATGMSCYYELPEGKVYAEGEAVPIGKPFKNTQILLLDENDQLADEGEICIRGTCLTLGYYDDPERTAAAFCQNPLNKLYPERIYRTGDIARRDSDGNLLFVSRKDGQIKHMGHRIELGEIEAAANALSSVTSACCVFEREKKKLYLFYAGAAQRGDLMVHLRGKLPAYMLPQAIIQLDRMPTTDNGKLDRAGLKKLASEQ